MKRATPHKEWLNRGIRYVVALKKDDPYQPEKIIDFARKIGAIYESKDGECVVIELPQSKREVQQAIPVED